MQMAKTLASSRKTPHLHFSGHPIVPARLSHSNSGAKSIEFQFPCCTATNSGYDTRKISRRSEQWPGRRPGSPACTGGCGTARVILPALFPLLTDAQFSDAIPYFDRYANSSTFWSPDSKWLVYTNHTQRPAARSWSPTPPRDPLPARSAKVCSPFGPGNKTKDTIARSHHSQSFFRKHQPSSGT